MIRKKAMACYLGAWARAEESQGNPEAKQHLVNGLLTPFPLGRPMAAP
jgi:hypothetical protein